MPITIDIATGRKIEYFYGATGIKLKKKVTDGTTITETKYLDGFQYQKPPSGVWGLDFFPHAEGYVKAVPTGFGGTPTSIAFKYVFNYTDHLGNIRLKYAEDPSNGNAISILEEDHYYPYGLKHKGYSSIHLVFNDEPEGPSPGITLTPVNPFLGDSYKYKFGGKEYDDTFDINTYDFGARNYDPALGRWMNIDPLAEMMRRHSPYNYAFDNPVYFVDPDGMIPISGAASSGLFVSDTNFLGTSDTSTGGFGTNVSTVDKDGNVLETQYVEKNGDLKGAITAASDKVFNDQVDTAYGDKADTAAPNNKETVNEVVGNIPILKDQYDSFEGKVSINVSKNFQSTAKETLGADAITYTDNGKLNGNPHVTLFRASFETYRYLARTLFHEFVHVQDYRSGIIYQNYLSICGSGSCSEYQARQGALYLSEVNAYRRGFEVTGQPYTPGYTKAVNFLNSNGINY